MPAGRTRGAAPGSGQGAPQWGLLFSPLRFPGCLEQGGGWLLQSISKRREWSRHPATGTYCNPVELVTQRDPSSPAASLCVFPYLERSSFLEKE